RTRTGYEGGTHMKVARLARLTAVPIVLVAAIVIAVATGSSGHVGNTVAPQGALYAPGGAADAGEVSIAKVEDYWKTRLTYPTGRLDPAWLKQAASQEKKIPA